MLEIKCDKCGCELDKPGALVFSPPTSEKWLVEKYHVCSKCWRVILTLFQDKPEQPIN